MQTSTFALYKHIQLLNALPELKRMGEDTSWHIATSSKSPIREIWGGYMRWVKNRQKITALLTKKREQEDYWPFSLGAMMQSNIWQTTLFHLWPCSSQTTLLFCFSCYILWLLQSSFPASLPPPPSFAGTPLFPFISTSLTPTTALTLSLTGRAAVDDTYPAESSHAGSMDHGTLRGEIAPQPVCFHWLCVCVCMCLFIWLLQIWQNWKLLQWHESHSMRRHCMYVCVCVRSFFLSFLRERALLLCAEQQTP